MHCEREERKCGEGKKKASREGKEVVYIFLSKMWNTPVFIY